MADFTKINTHRTKEKKSFIIVKSRVSSLYGNQFQFGMKKLSHNLTSLIGGLAILRLCFDTLHLSVVYYIIALIAMFVLGGINDTLDFTFFAFLDHRNFWSHSLLSPVLWILPVIVYLIFQILLPPLGILMGACTVWAVLSHLFLDAWNPTGIYLLPSKKIKGTVQSNNGLVNFSICSAELLLLIGMV